MASITAHNIKSGQRRYTVRYRDPSHHQQQKTFRRKADAERFCSAVEADMDRGTYVDPRSGKATFHTLADRWTATRTDMARSTRDRDQSYLNSLILPTFGCRPVMSITASEIEVWNTTMDKAPNTRGKALQILRSILDLARRDRIIATNPASDVRPPSMKPKRIARALPDHELDAVIAAAEEVDERTAILVHLMARCGLRISEALALRRRDVDLDAKRLTVATSMSRREGIRPVKGRHREDEGRIIPIPSDVVNRLLRHFNECAVTNIGGFVVTAPRGGPLPYDRWRSRIWTKIAARVNFVVKPHDLRRTAATRLFVVDRWTPAEVMAFLGHRDPRVTLAIYALVEAETLPQPSSLNIRSI